MAIGRVVLAWIAYRLITDKSLARYRPCETHLRRASAPYSSADATMGQSRNRNRSRREMPTGKSTMVTLGLALSIPGS